MRIKRTLAAVVTGGLTATLIVAVPGAAAAATNTTTTSEVVSALEQTDVHNNKLVLDAAPSTVDTDSAAQTRIVDVPANPENGVKLKGVDGQTMTIGLPKSQQAGKGIKTRKGLVAYSGQDGSANAVVPTNTGVQMLTTIESRKAPTKYSYPLTLPKGGKIKLAPHGAGAIVVDGKGKLLTLVPPPWAKDANGKNVRTWFTTNGHTLTQYVAHKAQGVTYPVVADPLWLFVPAWVMRACGLGFLSGWGSAWISGDDFWRRWGNGAWNCIVGAIGLGWLRK